MGAVSGAVSKGTTPTFIFNFNENDVDFTLVNNVYVTFKSNLKTITKSGSDLTIYPHSIAVILEQAETLSFQVDEVEVQVNWTYENRRRGCSYIKDVGVLRNLLMKEVD